MLQILPILSSGVVEGLQYLPLSISRSWQLILNEQNSFRCFSILYI